MVQSGHCNCCTYIVDPFVTFNPTTAILGNTLYTMCCVLQWICQPFNYVRGLLIQFIFPVIIAAHTVMVHFMLMLYSVSLV